MPRPWRTTVIFPGYLVTTLVLGSPDERYSFTRVGEFKPPNYWVCVTWAEDALVGLATDPHRLKPGKSLVRVGPLRPRDAVKASCYVAVAVADLSGEWECISSLDIARQGSTREDATVMGGQRIKDAKGHPPICA